MIKISDDGSAAVKLPKSVYSKKSIVECLGIYSEFLYAKLEEGEKSFRLTITSKSDDYNSSELADELVNYLISLERENK